MTTPQNSLSDPYPTPLYAWYVIAVLLLALTVSFVDRQIMSLMVQPIRADLGLSDTAIGLLQGFAFVLFYTFLGIVLGRFADHGQRRMMIIIGMILWCLATAACGLARNFTELFVARMLVGVGEATLSPAAYSLISDLFPRHRRARAMSVYTMGIFVGSGGALILGGLAVAATSRMGQIVLPLVGEVHAWQAAFMLVGLPGLLVAALMATVREPSRKERTTDTAAPSNTLAFLKQRRGLIAATCLGFGVNAVIAFSFAAWVPTMFIRVFGWSAGDVAKAYGVILLTAGVGGVFAGGWVADIMVARGKADGIILAAVAGLVATAPVIPFVGLARSPGLCLAALTWVTFFIGMPTTLAPTAIHAITPNEHRGQVTSLYLFAANAIGLGFGPVMVAFCTDRLFADDHAVGKSLAIVTTTATIVSLFTLMLARRNFQRLAETDKLL